MRDDRQRMAQQRAVVNTIPSHDSVLRRLVDHVTAVSPPASAAELTERLRPLYPRVAVFERQLSGEGPYLYVYRDGRYEPEDRNPWWDAPGVPCIDVSARSGELTEITGAWAELMRSEEADLVGRHFLDFVKPDARATAATMFEALQSEREVRSKAIVQRPDGSTLFIEFRAARRDDEIEVCFRPLER